MKHEDAVLKSKHDKLQNEEQYIAPDIEVIDIEIEQNVLSGSGNLFDYDGEDW